jgi:hypothetical protein
MAFSELPSLSRHQVRLDEGRKATGVDRGGIEQDAEAALRDGNVLEDPPTDGARSFVNASCSQRQGSRQRSSLMLFIFGFSKCLRFSTWNTSFSWKSDSM